MVPTLHRPCGLVQTQQQPILENIQYSYRNQPSKNIKITSPVQENRVDVFQTKRVELQRCEVGAVVM